MATIFQMSHISSFEKLRTFMAPQMIAKYSLSPMSLPSCSWMMSQLTVSPWKQAKKTYAFLSMFFCSVYSKNEKHSYLRKVLVLAWVLDKVEFFEIRS